MRRFVGVLLEFDAAVNPEPRVARAPTTAEQAAALARLAERLGGGAAWSKSCSSLDAVRASIPQRSTTW